MEHYNGGLLENLMWFHLCCSTDGCLPLFVFLRLRGPFTSDLPIGGVFKNRIVSYFVRCCSLNKRFYMSEKRWKVGELNHSPEGVVVAALPEIVNFHDFKEKSYRQFSIFSTGVRSLAVSPPRP